MKQFNIMMKYFFKECIYIAVDNSYILYVSLDYSFENMIFIQFKKSIK